jgi:hypothetical protein
MFRFRKDLLETLYMQSANQYFRRLNPSICIMNTMNHHFRLQYRVEGKESKEFKDSKKVYYSIITENLHNPNQNVDEIYEELKLASTYIYAKVLDISYLDYPFSIKMPNAGDNEIYYMNEGDVNNFYKDIMNIKKEHNIKEPIDFYKISNIMYITFDNSKRFIR